MRSRQWNKIKCRQVGSPAQPWDTEIICAVTPIRDAMLQHVPGLCVVQQEHASLLGCPIGTHERIQDTIHAPRKRSRCLGRQAPAPSHT